MNNSYSNKMIGVVCGLLLISAWVPVAHGKQQSMKPATNQYSFVAKDSDLRYLVNDIYPAKREKGKDFSAVISEPGDHSICFFGQSSAMHIPEGKGISLSFPSGMYPFQIFRSVPKAKGKYETSCKKLGAPLYTGAMAFYNYDKEMELTSFGRSAETKMIDPALLEKTQGGVLTSHTIKFEDKPRISYWVGNRQSWFTGGDPTVELDFSKVNIAELKINNKVVKGRTTVLPIAKMQKVDGEKRLVGIEHRIAMKLNDGREYEGYIHRLLDNEHTAFMKVDCNIPDELFAAASRGTVAKFDINASSSDGRTEVKLAEIVFGVKQ